MSDDKTAPPGKAKPGKEDDDEDRTILAQVPPEDGGEGADADEEDERTVLNLGSEAQVEDADRTIIAPSAPDAGAEDEDRTILASGGEDDADPDRTIVAPAATDPDGGSTYRPLGDVTAATATAAGAAGGAFSGGAEPGGTTAGIVPPAPDADPTPLSSLEPGTVINNMYRVEARLDQGGMGRVFRGVEIATEEPVAIKVILPEMSEDQKVAQMFRREARTLRQLHHDAIVRYFAYVPPDQNLNLHALVMGFIEGTKLSDKLKNEGALTEKQVLKLTHRLADGLHRAHEIGIVHRDLSPDNVMLPDGDIGKAVLIDFGISRSSKIKDVTIGNEFAGKLKYVSPEQLGAFGGDAGPPSDVYSLGLLMIAMLTGKAVPMGDTIVEAVQQRQSVPDLTALPSDFQGMLYKMLQPDPAARLASMEAVKDELRAIDDGDTAFGTRSRSPMPPAEDRAVPGLQAVPLAARSQVTSPSTNPPSPNASLDVSSDSTGGRGGLGLITAILVLGAAGIGGALYYTGAIDFGPAEVAEEGDPVAVGLTRVEGTRETFLAEAMPETCAFATLRGQGVNSGQIEGFTSGTSMPGGVGAGFESAFGAAPEIIDRDMPAAQCAVLDFARAMQGTRAPRIELALDANQAARGDGVVGRVFGSDGRQNWLALVDPNGRVFSLMRQFDDPIGNERRFAFRLPSATPGTYLVVATASDAPLVRAGAMQDGTTSGDLFPLMLRELAVDGQGAVDIAFLNLTR